MSAADNGGAAFPVPEPGLETVMTLRDYFAARLMPHVWTLRQPLNNYDCARVAYEMADAMIRARTA